MAFKLPSLKRDKGPQPAKAGNPAAKPPAGQPAAAESPGLTMKPPAGALPMIGHLPVGRQLQILGSVLLVLLAAMAVGVFFDGRQATQGTAYVAAAGEMRMLSQRIAKASQQALQGNSDAFKQLLESRDRFSLLVKTLNEGGNVGEVAVPATSDQVRPVLESLG
jgi:twitching motility protein PilJ